MTHSNLSALAVGAGKVSAVLAVQGAILDRALRHLVDHTADAVFGIDASGRVTCWNAGAERLFGFTSAEVLDQSCALLLGGRNDCGTRVCLSDCNILHSALVLDENVPSFEVDLNTRANGPIRVNVTILPYKDKFTGESIALHLCRDESPAKAKEELIRQIAGICATIQQPLQRPTAQTISPLTDQEQKLLLLLSKGSDPKAVAHELNISPRTLRNHLSNINRKLGTRSRLEAVMQAVRTGLV